MKTRLLILSFVLIHITPAFATQNLLNQRGFIGVSNMNDPLDAKIINARQGAINLIDLAIKRDQKIRENPALLSLLFDLIKILRETPISKRDPNDSLITSCENLNLDLYVPTKPFKKIFRVCKPAFNYPSTELEQAFVHEAFHIFENISQAPYLLDDVKREVFATKYELLVMNSALGCAHFNNGYFNQSKYRTLLDQYQIKPLRLCNGSDSVVAQSTGSRSGTASSRAHSHR